MGQPFSKQVPWTAPSPQPAPHSPIQGGGEVVDVASYEGAERRGFRASRRGMMGEDSGQAQTYDVWRLSSVISACSSAVPAHDFCLLWSHPLASRSTLNTSSILAAGQILPEDLCHGHTPTPPYHSATASSSPGSELRLAPTPLCKTLPLHRCLLCFSPGVQRVSQTSGQR